MAISKTYILPNGVPVGYHRIEQLSVVSHARCHVLVKSYIDQASRQREIHRWEETRQPPYETDIPEQYSYMREIDMPFAGELSIESAYAYLKTMPEFDGAVDILDDSKTDDSPGFYEQAQAALEGAMSLRELTEAVEAGAENEADLMDAIADLSLAVSDNAVETADVMDAIAELSEIVSNLMEGV